MALPHLGVGGGRARRGRPLFFLKYRAQELAEIVTTVHQDLEEPAHTAEPAVVGAGAAGPVLTEPERPRPAGPPRSGGRTWWLHDVSHADTMPAPTGVRPGIPRFLAVALSQLVSMTGSALTEFAVPPSGSTRRPGRWRSSR
ncbi:hypothetical protein [Nonomuraea salmonea]|uniref:hypothetical protein n=1 Tax=Nonomuraea salmonea TaxID=46181 RepID=UPI002FEDD7A4